MIFVSEKWTSYYIFTQLGVKLSKNLLLKIQLNLLLPFLQPLLSQSTKNPKFLLFLNVQPSWTIFSSNLWSLLVLFCWQAFDLQTSRAAATSSSLWWTTTTSCTTRRCRRTFSGRQTSERVFGLTHSIMQAFR